MKDEILKNFKEAAEANEGMVSLDAVAGWVDHYRGPVQRKVSFSQNRKAQLLAREWVRWNNKEIKAERFVARFKEIFKRETTQAWKKFTDSH